MPYPYCSAAISWHAASVASWRDMVKTFHSVECHIVACDHIYWQAVWSPTCPLSLAPVFGADLLKSHVYEGVRFSTQDQIKEDIFYCISYGHAIERTSTPECVSYMGISCNVYICVFIYFHNFNQPFLISNEIKYRGHICVSIHNINSCSL